MEFRKQAVPPFDAASVPGHQVQMTGRRRVLRVAAWIIIGLIFLFPFSLNFVSASFLPTTWRFGNWPTWLQISYGIAALSFCAADVWFHFARKGKAD